MDSNDANIDGTEKQIPEGKKAVGERDVISTLHESILGHILSFLPIIEAVRTSVLSRRWIEVWTSITSLQFDDNLIYSEKKMKKDQFANFVEKVFLHFINSSIKSFSLFLTCYQYDASLINAWISFILERRVQKLHIGYVDKVFLYSNSLFSCNSLVELVLQGRCNLSFPISVCLPNLRNINIYGIKFVSDSSNYSKDITLSFPVLKVFEARGCEWSTMHNISLQVPLLERFSLTIWNHHSNESCKGSIKVNGVQLTDFYYEGDLEQDIILYDLSLIHNASVVLVIDEDKKDRIKKVGFQTHMLLRRICEVERLKLLFYKVLRHANDIFTNLPTFKRLMNLHLNEVTGEALLQLLHSSPILHTLVLLNGVSDLNKDVLTSSMVPKCFLSSFKVFEFKGFNANERDLSLIKFVMENAAIMEKMTIYLAFWLRYTDIDMEKVKEEILSLPKCSNFCIIKISDINSS